MKNNLLKALKKEIALTPTSFPITPSKREGIIKESGVIDTIYIGGGTPSLLNNDELKEIFETLYKKFEIAKNAEITLEANPDDINNQVLKDWLNAGINRLSIGVQSFDDDELKWMNRAHNAAESLICIDEIQDAGFSNFSVDLIYGTLPPTPSPKGEGKEKESERKDNVFKRNLEIIFNKKIPHISCYALTVEPKTLLSKLIAQKKSLPVNNDLQAEEFLLLMSMMKQEGYEHYEISNFAKPGMRSKHNSSYWRGIPYYGFGPSAHSYDGKYIRRWNIANNSLYIQSLEKNIIPFNEEVLTAELQLNEYIMTSLRTIEGLDLDFVINKFGEKYVKGILKGIKKFIDYGSVYKENNHFILTDKGKFLADGIASDMFIVSP